MIVTSWMEVVVRSPSCGRRRYAQTARQVLGENLVSVVLFGSVARGEAGPTSDIDLLVVLEDAPRGAFARHALLEPVRRHLAPEIERLWNRAVYTDFTEVVLTKDEASRSRRLYLAITQRKAESVLKACAILKTGG